LEKVGMIGQGTFGYVFRVRHKETGDMYALKEVSKSDLVKSHQTGGAVAERNVLREVSVRSPFVIKLHATYTTPSSLFFLTELVPYGDLMALMYKLVALRDSVGLFFSACVSQAIKYVHERGFVHRDIKPENLLLCKNGYLKLADFRLAKRLPSVVKVGRGRTEISLLAFTMCGTPEFIAPEFSTSVGYDRMVNWWSFGCVIYEMCMGRGPFDRGGDLKKTFKDVCMIGIGKSPLPLHPKFVERFPECAALLDKLVASVSSRIGNSGKGMVQDHEYFKGFEFEKLRNLELESPHEPEGIIEGICLDKAIPVNDYDGNQEWCQDF